MEKLTHTRFLTFPVLEKFDMIKSFYFFIHISFAIIITYLPAYMSASGYSGKQIALLMSIGFVMAFFAPLLIGIIADRTQRPALIMRILLASNRRFAFPISNSGHWIYHYYWEHISFTRFSMFL
jgi:MFS family permease